MSINFGSENLEVMREAEKYMAHVGRLVSANLPDSGKIIELGAGNGTQTKIIGIHRDRLICVESDIRMQKILGDLNFAVVENLSGLKQHEYAGAYSINCLEHIEDDSATLQNLHQKLKPGSTLVIYVPALPILFSSMDQRVGHVRRYTKNSLINVLEKSGFSISKIRYVDFLGVLVTLIFKVLGNKSGLPSKNSVHFYDKVLFPLSKLIDRAASRIIGKNLFVVAERL